MLFINEFFEVTGSDEPFDFIFQSYTFVHGMTYVLMKSIISFYILLSSLTLHRFWGPIQTFISHPVDVV